MGIFKDKRSAYRHMNLAAGAGALLAAGALVFRGQLPPAFLVAYFGLSAIVMAETDIDVTEKHNLKSFGQLLRRRAQISTMGKLCEVASYFCIVAAIASWLILR